MQCVETLWNDDGISMGDFLASLDTPVLLVDGDMVVQGGTASSSQMTGKELVDIQGLRGGNVFECVNASLPEGCGRTIHCSGCTLRRTITDTYATGQSHHRVPATLKVTSADEPEAIAIYVTTEKVAERVLLKIEGS